MEREVKMTQHQTSGFFPAGTKVWFRGSLSEQYSVRGVISLVYDRPKGSIKYGVRLENGNYKLCSPDQVRARGEK